MVKEDIYIDRWFSKKITTTLTQPAKKFGAMGVNCPYTRVVTDAGPSGELYSKVAAGASNFAGHAEQAVWSVLVRSRQRNFLKEIGESSYHLLNPCRTRPVPCHGIEH